MWCCELYCLILSKLTLAKWASGLKIFLQRHHWVLCYCFLPHSTLCFGTWGLGGCKPHFCFVSVLLPAGFCQPERQEEGARTCSFQFVRWFGTQWVPRATGSSSQLPSTLPNQQHHAGGSSSRAAPLLRAVSPAPWTLPSGAWGTSRPSPQRSGSWISRRLGLVSLSSSLGSLAPGVEAASWVTLSVTTVPLFPFSVFHPLNQFPLLNSLLK